jgi:phage terminase large subunit GpA-like protein
MQSLRWPQLRWKRGRPESAHYECCECGYAIDEGRKTAMLEGGEWRPEATASDPRRRSYTINALYSPAGLGSSWAELVELWSEAQRSRPALKTFVNTKLAEPWDDDSERIDAKVLKQRIEAYDPRTAPAGCLLPVAGVDVQGNRFEVTVWGFGAGQESWVLDHHVIPGDPTQAPPSGIWADLTEYLERPIVNSAGTELRIAAAAIDSGGHHTQQVYAYTRLFKARRWFAIKGVGGQGRALLSRPSNVDLAMSGRVLKAGAQVWPVGADTGKAQVYSRLQIESPGPGYTHIPAALGDEYLEQLTSERLVTGYQRGRPVHRWVVIDGRRNEALDCAVYALAAFHQIGADRWGAHEWRRLRDQVEPPTPDLFANSEAPPEQAARVGPVRRGGRRKSGWMNGAGRAR